MLMPAGLAFIFLSPVRLVWGPSKGVRDCRWLLASLSPALLSIGRYPVVKFKSSFWAGGASPLPVTLVVLYWHEAFRVIWQCFLLLCILRESSDRMLTIVVKQHLTNAVFGSILYVSSILTSSKHL